MTDLFKNAFTPSSFKQRPFLLVLLKLNAPWFALVFKVITFHHSISVAQKSSKIGKNWGKSKKNLAQIGSKIFLHLGAYPNSSLQQICFDIVFSLTTAEVWAHICHNTDNVLSMHSYIVHTYSTIEGRSYESPSVY